MKPNAPSNWQYRALNCPAKHSRVSRSEPSSASATLNHASSGVPRAGLHDEPRNMEEEHPMAQVPYKPVFPWKALVRLAFLALSLSYLAALLHESPGW